MLVLEYKIEIIITLIILITQLVVLKLVIPKIEKFTDNSRLKRHVFERARASVRLFSFLFSLSLILFVWGFNFKGLMTVSAGLVALLGVSLFASWSIISNVTAFFLLVFHDSYRRGNFIRVLSGDNYIEGYIAEINLFNTRLITEEKEVIVCPNILLMSSPAIINSKSRHNTVGKIADFAAKDKPDK